MLDLKKCRFCNSLKIKQLKTVKSPHFNYNYQLYFCEDCNSKFFNLEEHEVSLDEMYHDLSKEEKSGLLNKKFKEDKVWLYQKKKITTLLQKYPASILDVGCRTADFLMHFNNHVLKEGVELSNDYAEVCNKRGIKVYCDFVENIVFDKTYDVVTCYALLEHVTEPIKVIDSLKKLVNKDGLLVIMVPWHECLKEKILCFFGIRWHMYSPPEHLNLFSHKILNDVIINSNEFKLVYKYSSSGGMFNPFRRIPLFNKAFGYFMFQLDKTYLNKLQLFDHLYLYYKRIN